MKKGVVKVAALGLAAAMALSGCGGGGSGKEAEGGKVKLRFASWDSAEDLDTQQELVDKFNASQDKIEVALEAYGQDYDTTVSYTHLDVYKRQGKASVEGLWGENSDRHTGRKGLRDLGIRQRDLVSSCAGGSGGHHGSRRWFPGGVCSESGLGKKL